jgi:diguanylate cyclase (GGDEF)-like protein
MKVLLIEDSPVDVRLIQEYLVQAGGGLFEVEWTSNLSASFKRLGEGGIDAVLLDLGLPESQGLDTFLRVYAQAGQAPVVILTSHNDETLAIRALQEGAQDYLFKGEIDARSLVRALRYAIERRQLQAALSQMSHDELTGLYNYRGFHILAQQYSRLACRSQTSFLYLFIDLDNLKRINDQFGHVAGNHALCRTADVLRQSFRSSDVLGRVGGDEFAALVLNAGRTAGGIIVARLRANVEAHNSKSPPPWPFSISVGLACFDPQNPFSIEQLMSAADQAMYAEKRAKKGRSTEAGASSEIAAG